MEPGARLAHHVELLDTTVGRFTSIGRYTKDHFADIGPFGSVASDSTIGATGHPLDRATTHAFPYRRELGLVEDDHVLDRPRASVGPDVWIGCHVVIMSGVVIGAGAVIGAGSVVTLDVPAYAIVAGAPARMLSLRLESDLIGRMLAVRWRDWPEAAIRAAAEALGATLDAETIGVLEGLPGDAAS